MASSRARTRACVWLVLIALCPSSRSKADAAPEDGSAPTKITKLAEGVRIDWSTPAVEVDAEVVLRKGALELFACTPGTREHESILVVHGKPTHVFQALGMIGLKPGTPVSYDEKKQRNVPATGDAVEVWVRYRKQGHDHLVPAAAWMAASEDDKPLGDVRWVFAGSRRVDKTTLGAEIDGTLICVVNFETALIAVDALHTSANEELWLVANTQAIPPVGTPCTLVLRPPAIIELRAILKADGSFQLANRPIDAARLAALWKDRHAGHRQVRMTLETVGVAPGTIKTAVDLLVQHGIDRKAIRLRGADESDKSDKADKTDKSGTTDKPSEVGGGG